MCEIVEGLPLPEEELEQLRSLQSSVEISVVAARLRLMHSIYDSMERAEDTLVNAPTGLGKTYEIATTPWLDFPEYTDNEPVIHISLTKDARDSAAEMSEEAGLNYKVLRAREEVCPVAEGEYDGEIIAPGGRSPSEWFNQKCDVEQIRFSGAHNYLDSYCGGLPCTTDSDCESQRQWIDVPRTEDGEPTYDVIHATGPFAQIPDLIENANVVFDERPEFNLDISQEQIRQAVNDLLERRSGSVQYTWEEMVILSKQQTRLHLDDSSQENAQRVVERVAEYYSLVADEIADPLSHDMSESIHMLTPAISRAVLVADDMGNERFAGHDSGVSVVFDEQNTIQIVHSPPDLSLARCVIGLDAHPSELLWEFHTGLDLNHVYPLSEAERRYWRTQERGLFVVQIGEDTNPLTRGWRNDRQRLEVQLIIEKLREKFGDAFRTAVVPSSIEDDIEIMMGEAGIENPGLLHYGEEMSLNIFEGEQVGLLVGCIDPGDSFVLNLLAVMGQYAEPEMRENESGEEYRAHGRGFVGPEADAANEFLESVRETHIAQSIGRYARNARESDSGAIVFGWTDTIPDDLVDFRARGLVERLTGEGQLSGARVDVERFVRESDGSVTKSMVAEEVGISDEHAWRVLGEMEEHGIVERSPRTGPHGADEYEYQSGTLGPTVDLTFQ